MVGATNWWPPAYSPRTKNVYVPVIEMPSVFYTQEDEFVAGEYYVGVVGRQTAPAVTSVRSLTSTAGELTWERKFTERDHWTRIGGLLSTAGDVLFVGDFRTFYSLDIESGDILWQINTGGGINAAPITYRVDGVQFVTIAAGRTLMSFGLSGHLSVDR